MGEPEARTRIARAALYIATEMGDHERQAAARKLLAGPVDEGHEQQTATWTSDDQSPRSRRTPKRTKTLIASAAESVSKAFTIEVCNLLIAVISAGSEHAAR